MSKFKDLFPQNLLKGDFSIIADLADLEFTKVENLITRMTTLTNIDRCPEDFLTHLGDIIDFKFYEGLDRELQRECLKYYLPASKEIGNLHDISMMATYGDNPGYQGGNLFIPGTFEDKPLAGVIFPRDFLFSWSKSAWSGVDKLPGNQIYREGTLLIEVSNLNQVIMDRVEKVKPAGLLVVYKLVKDDEIKYITHTRVLNDK